MSMEELDAFERLLQQDDHDIYAWILGAAPAPPAFDDALMAALRAFRPNAPDPRTSDAVQGG